MKEKFEQYKEWLSSNYEDGLKSLNPPASEDEIQHLEVVINQKLPDGLKECLKINNGQSEGTHGLLNGQKFLSTSEIIEKYETLKSYLKLGYIKEGHIHSEKGIKSADWNEKWIPFAGNQGDHYFIDNDPAENGSSGQVIFMWEDTGECYLEGKCFSDWFTGFVNKCSSGELVFDEIEGIVSPDDL